MRFQDQARPLGMLRHAQRARAVAIAVSGDAAPALRGELSAPSGSRGLVLVARGRSGRRPPDELVRARLLRRGLASLVVELAVGRDGAAPRGLWDVGPRPVEIAVHWLAAQPGLAELSLGLFGIGAGAALVLRAAAALPDRVAAVVCWDGGPALGDAAERVTAPTLLVARDDDPAAIGGGDAALAHLRSQTRLAVVERTGSQDLARVADLAADWFAGHLAPSPGAPMFG